MIDPDLLPRVIAGIRNGRYSLLLGAGFSATCKDAVGRNLPVGQTLADEIAIDFGLPKGYSLAQLSTAIGDKLDAYLTRRFTGCAPSPGVSSVPAFAWQHIFTFNIDDALVSAYEGEATVSKERRDTPIEALMTHRSGRRVFLSFTSTEAYAPLAMDTRSPSRDMPS